MQRFFVSPETLKEKNIQDAIAISDPELLHQINRVLRMRKGDRCVLLDNTGDEFECSAELCDPKAAIFRITNKIKNASEPEVELTVFQALPKKMELFEWVLQKGTEIGVTRFVPLVTARTERENFPRRDRLEKILKEAAEQSGRGKIPTLGDTVSLSSQTATPELRIVLHPDLDTNNSSPALATYLPQIHAEKACAIFVGPEGGFTNEEVTTAINAGMIIARLGSRTLRTETAGIVAASLIYYIT